MSIKELFNKDLIWTNPDLTNAEAVFEMVFEKASNLNLVNDNFLEKIKLREVKYPTGIQLERYGVAIPHTDADTIREQFIGVITSKEGVPFKRMDDPNQQVEANVIFVLGLKEPHQQLEALQQLMAIIQNEDTVDVLVNRSNVEEILRDLQNVIAI